jgi:hypothetical protein
METNNKENETDPPMAHEGGNGGITDDRAVKPVAEESTPEETITEGVQEGVTVEKAEESNLVASTEGTPPEATGDDSAPQARSSTEEEDAASSSSPTQEDPTTPTEIPEETSKGPNKEERKEAPTDLAALQRPVKRARTAYFIFAEDRRPALQKQVSQTNQHMGVGNVCDELVS